MAKKIVKTYESFVNDKHFKFEENVIDPILICIRENQEYLTQPENLPQLAKLGYMYNTLWYDGRVCWGSDGILRDGATTTDEDGEETGYWDCEDNPKYKIEMCNPQNEEIENLIYDAWAMHVTNGRDNVKDSKTFFNLIKNGKPLSELERKMLKVNKTLEDWVEIKLDPNYKYKSLYSNRRSISDNLLCTIGTGYGWNRDGFIIEEAGGADQDLAGYGDWQNAKFAPQIQEVVNRILNMPQVAMTIDAANQHISKLKKEREDKEKAEKAKWRSMFLGKLKDQNLISDDVEDDDDDDDLDIDQIIKNLYAERTGKQPEEYKEPYHAYYPISSSSNIYAMLSDEKRTRLGITKFDQSYIDGAIEICKDIIDHEEEENKEREENVDFAKKFLNKYGVGEYDIPKEVDKYALLSEIEDAFLYVTDSLTKAGLSNNFAQGTYNLYLNDTKTNDYADNNYYFTMSLKGYGLPVGYSNHIEFLKSASFYSDIQQVMNRLKGIKEIKTITVYCDNGNIEYSDKVLNIRMMVNDKSNYEEDKKLNDEYLESLGFQVGSRVIVMETKDYIMSTQKPEPLGRKHPNNTSGKDFYSLNKQMSILTKAWTKKCDFSIDERSFNIISANNTRDASLKERIIEEHKKMKLSDPGYGLYGIKGNDIKYEGKKYLYAHDFIVWLKNNGF